MALGLKVKSYMKVEFFEEDNDGIVSNRVTVRVTGEVPASLPSGGTISDAQLAMFGDNPNRKEKIIPAELLEGMSNSINVKGIMDMFHPSNKTGSGYINTNKIGIGITTHNRPEAFYKTLSHIIAYLPADAVIAIVDDASKEPYTSDATGSDKLKYRFEKNVGIAQAKNKCLEMLYNAGCEHLFLFDDDTYPMVDEWHEKYIESGESHLMYIFESFANAKGPHDMIKVYQDDKIAAYSHVRGCMLYYRRVVLDIVGGMYPFGKWGNEHGDLSNRIYSAGLTRFRYMDVANSKGLFYAADEQEHGKFISTVPGAQRIELLKKGKPIYDSHYNKPVYCEFRETINPVIKQNVNPLFLTAYFTTLPDPQRPGHKWEFDKKITDVYIDSIYLTCGFNQDTIILYDGEKLQGLSALYRTSKWEHVQTSINPYFQRWMSYYEYLLKNRDRISWVFMTDCTDVELLKMPEPERGKIYVGDEPDIVGKSQWLQYHHKHPDLQRFYQTHARCKMLNAGILGGYVEDVMPFIRAIIDTYTRMMHESARNPRIPGPGMTDMGIFNYVARTMFNEDISHGEHVNTKFKANERSKISWWKHK